MADIDRLVKISSENFHRLEQEVQRISTMASLVATQYPKNTGLKKLHHELSQLHLGFFVASVPLSDPSVATMLINETIKANKELTTELSATKDWIMSSSVVKGNE